MNKLPKNLPLFFAISALTVSIIMLAAAVVCYNIYVPFEVHDTYSGKTAVYSRHLFGNYIFFPTLVVSFFAVPIMSFAAQFTVWMQNATNRLTNITTILVVVYVLCGILRTIVLNIFIDNISPPVEVTIEITVLSMIPAVNLLSYITTIFLKRKMEWLLYTMAQTLFIINIPFNFGASWDLMMNGGFYFIKF